MWRVADSRLQEILKLKNLQNVTVFSTEIYVKGRKLEDIIREEIDELICEEIINIERL